MFVKELTINHVEQHCLLYVIDYEWGWLTIYYYVKLLLWKFAWYFWPIYFVNNESVKKRLIFVKKICQ